MRIIKSCYNIVEVMSMSAQVDQLIKDAQQLSVDDLRLLCRVLLKQLAVPLQEPESIYDDWKDAEVDATYADTW